MVVIQNNQPTSDITPDALTAFQHLMLAQAQEIFVLKAINGEYISIIFFFYYNNKSILTHSFFFQII